jgi:glycoside/pentoside/hexuronide:cation symporter, GPH family
MRGNEMIIENQIRKQPEILQSFIKSDKVEMKEKVLGYFVGPCGGFLFNAVLVAYLNIYYTDVLGLTDVSGGMFLFAFPLISKVLDVIINFSFGVLIDKTRTKHGKARPYLILSGFLMAISGILAFAVPEHNELVKLIWVVVSFNLCFAVSFSIFNLSHSLMVPLSTRNSAERGPLSVLNNMASMGMQGIVVGAIFPTFIMPMIGVDKGAWITTMTIVSCIALPLTLLEYYFTKERVTEENMKMGIVEKKVSVSMQLKEVVKDKIWWLVMAYYVFFFAGAQLRNASLLYYCNYVVGTYNDGITPTLINIIGGIPMAIGMFIAWPLGKKIGKRNAIMIGFVFYALGSIITYAFASDITWVLVGQIIKNFGSIPAIYLLAALLADVLDHMEWKSGFRCDGITISVTSSIMTIMSGLALAVFNLLLSKSGYIQPYMDNGVLLATQTESVNNVITFSFVGVEIITSIIIIIILVFLNVEKGLEEKQKDILERKQIEMNKK